MFKLLNDTQFMMITKVCDGVKGVSSDTDINRLYYVKMDCLCI